jgi:hypothetical protein
MITNSQKPTDHGAASSPMVRRGRRRRCRRRCGPDCRGNGRSGGWCGGPRVQRELIAECRNECGDSRCQLSIPAARASRRTSSHRCPWRQPPHVDHSGPGRPVGQVGIQRHTVAGVSGTLARRAPLRITRSTRCATSAPRSVTFDGAGLVHPQRVVQQQPDHRRAAQRRPGRGRRPQRPPGRGPRHDPARRWRCSPHRPPGAPPRRWAPLRRPELNDHPQVAQPAALRRSSAARHPWRVQPLLTGLDLG